MSNEETKDVDMADASAAAPAAEGEVSNLYMCECSGWSWCPPTSDPVPHPMYFSRRRRRRTPAEAAPELRRQ